MDGLPGRGTFYLTEPTALVTPLTLSQGEVVALLAQDTLGARNVAQSLCQSRRRAARTPAPS